MKPTSKSKRPVTGKLPVWRRARNAGAAKWWPLLLLLFLPAVAQAQFDYTIVNGTSVTITNYTGAGGDVNIPATIADLPVTSIGTSAFARKYSVTSVTIPESVTSIGTYAFDTCSRLTDVTIPGSVTNIGEGAFIGCSLTRVTIPDSVTSIGANEFWTCYSLTNITIPNSVTSLGDSAFGFCLSLTRVTIPDSVTSIGDWAFAYSGLTRVTVPDSVTNIGDGAFTTSFLTSATVGNSVTSIGTNAFDACTYLTSVFFSGNAPSPGANLFNGVTNVTVYYLPGTTGWGTTYGGRPAVLWNPVMLSAGISYGVQGNQFGFTVTGTLDIPFVVEACTDLSHPQWTPLGTYSLTGASFDFTDPDAANNPTRFYRLRNP